MIEKGTIVIGTRSSDLALWQANFLKNEIEKKHKKVNVILKHVKTKGDKIVDVALSKIGDKGLFTKELEKALLRKEIDIAVHSLKDLQTEVPEGLRIAAITKRHKVEDVLIARKEGTTIDKLPENCKVGTGSLRRRSQLGSMRPDITVEELRGNVPTRIQKFLDSDWDAIILARAGVERLKLQKHISSVIPVYQVIPAVGQGALGIEIREEDEETYKILQKINHEETAAAVYAERAFLRELEGGCQIPIGANCVVKKNGIYLSGYIGSVDGSVSFRAKMRGSRKEPEKLGIKLAKKMKKAGADKVLNEIFERVR